MSQNYIFKQNRFEFLQAKFNDLSSSLHLISGNIDLNETIEFKHKLTQPETVTAMQEHFAFLAMQALEQLEKNSSTLEKQAYSPIVYSCELTILGDDGYTTTDPYEFTKGILCDLPNAEGCIIKSSYSGPATSDTSLDESFYKVVDRSGIYDECSYTAFEFRYDCGEGNCYKYENGHWIDLDYKKYVR